MEVFYPDFTGLPVAQQQQQSTAEYFVLNKQFVYCNIMFFFCITHVYFSTQVKSEMKMNSETSVSSCADSKGGLKIVLDPCELTYCIIICIMSISRTVKYLVLLFFSDL